MLFGFVLIGVVIAGGVYAVKQRKSLPGTKTSGTSTASQKHVERPLFDELCTAHGLTNAQKEKIRAAATDSSLAEQVKVFTDRALIESVDRELATRLFKQTDSRNSESSSVAESPA